jgi:anti-sigma factor RsiW
MDCNELVELVTEYLEKALPQERAARLEAHLAECPGCAEYVEQIRTAARVAGGLEPSLSSEEADRLLQIFQNWKGTRTTTP